MESNKEIQQSITQWLQLLTDERSEPLDFDHLCSLLNQVSHSLESEDTLQSELQLLRQDIYDRITGMVKAIAAVDRKRDRYREAGEVIDSLSGLSAQELVDCYRRIQARFRDFFPTSFGQVTTRSLRQYSERTNRTDFK